MRSSASGPPEGVLRQPAQGRRIVDVGDPHPAHPADEPGGVRDISVIETPPEGRRPIRTYVGPYEDELVRRAIEREVERGGQAFFLHNRIETLPEVAEGLRASRRAEPPPSSSRIGRIDVIS
jgi:hypothetical protein